jgi:hypothetical protein
MFLSLFFAGLFKGCFSKIVKNFFVCVCLYDVTILNFTLLTSVVHEFLLSTRTVRCTDQRNLVMKSRF